MPVLSPERADEVVAGWRRSTAPSDGFDNPAGELYASGTFAEADIVMAGAETRRPSICTGAGTIPCC